MSSQELMNSLQILNEEYNLAPGYPIPVSSMTGLGKRDIWRVIRSAIIGELFAEATDDDEDEEEEDGIPDPVADLLR
jgi:hypothetical protein